MGQKRRSRRGGEERCAVLDLDNLLDSLTGNPVSGCGSRIGSDDDSIFESEGKCCGSVGNLYWDVWVCGIVGDGAEEGGWL